MSSYFNISNGVRQGGILSPSLFAIYMDDLSSLLNTSRIGCHISDVCINHVFYADDLCLMVSCAIALQDNDNDNDNTFIEHKYRLQMKIYR